MNYYLLFLFLILIFEISIIWFFGFYTASVRWFSLLWLIYHLQHMWVIKHQFPYLNFESFLILNENENIRHHKCSAKAHTKYTDYNNKCSWAANQCSFWFSMISEGSWNTEDWSNSNRSLNLIYFNYFCISTEKYSYKGLVVLVHKCISLWTILLTFHQQ